MSYSSPEIFWINPKYLHFILQGEKFIVPVRKVPELFMMHFVPQVNMISECFIMCQIICNHSMPV